MSTSISFPSNPAVNDTYTYASATYKWNGTAWLVVGASIPAFGTTAGTACQGNDSRLSDSRTPIDSSVAYAKVASALKQRATVTSTIDLSANGIGLITLSANTAFAFTNFELNKTYLLIITPNNYTPSWAAAAKHIAVEGNVSFGLSGVFYVSLTCIDATASAEKLLTMIMKGA